MRRIGFLSGTFDPPHAGHIALAKSALTNAGLDHIYFIPEANPRRKDDVAPLKDRIEMLNLATAAFPKLSVLILPDLQLTPAHTVPELESRFPRAELFMVTGSDMLRHLPDWESVEILLRSMDLIIGLRDSETKELIEERIAGLSQKPKQAITVETSYPASSSRIVKADLEAKSHSPDLSPAVENYIKDKEIYSLSSSSLTE